MVTILLDMDEVLVDFVSAAIALHGQDRETVYARWKPGKWSMTEPLQLTPDQFWEPIHRAGADFWVNLEPKPWIEELIKIVEQYTRNWHVVTSPSRCPTCYDGKVRWLKNYFGPGFDRFAITPHKHLFAKPNTILIDDRGENCRKFEAYGGDAIIFPAIQNCLHWRRDNPLEFVSGQLAAILSI